MEIILLLIIKNNYLNLLITKQKERMYKIASFKILNLIFMEQFLMN